MFEQFLRDFGEIIGESLVASIGIVGTTGLALYGYGKLKEYFIRRGIRKHGYQTSFEHDKNGNIYFPREIFFPEDL